MERVSVIDLNFVKIEPRGRGISNKFWVEDKGILKLVKSSDATDQDIMEMLSFKILQALELDCVEVELGYDKYSQQNCCLVTNFLDEGDVSYEMTNWKIVCGKDDEEELRMCFEQLFQRYSQLFAITQDNLEDIKKQYIRLIFGKCILENFDTKLENVGLIFNEITGTYRLPKSYDNGCSFINYESITKPICYIGNQFFEISKVVEYILTYYLDYVEDIIPRIHTFVEKDMGSILEPFTGEIVESKRQYIIKYLQDMDEFIQKYNKNKAK